MAETVVVFRDALARAFPFCQPKPDQRIEQIHAFAEAHGWTATIFDPRIRVTFTKKKPAVPLEKRGLTRRGHGSSAMPLVASRQAAIDLLTRRVALLRFLFGECVMARQEQRFRLTISLDDALGFALGDTDLDCPESTEAMRRIIGFFVIDELEYNEYWREAAQARLCLADKWPGWF